MSFLCFGGRGVLPAICSLLVFSGVLSAQSVLPLREPPGTGPAGPSAFSTQPCQPADFDLHLRSPMRAGNPNGPICGTASADTPKPLACVPSSGRASRCEDAGDSTTRSVLTSLGKKGQSITAARTRVLEILEADNACAAWFRKLDPDPARTFRTLSFAVDEKAIDYVIERSGGGVGREFVNPYVATVLQDGGEFQAVTLNAGGAFFRPSATLVRLAREGGPVQFQGARMLKVGPYMGDTLQARLTTLLHELGHVLGLLPLDTNDVNGQSAANTQEVLRHCQSEIESRAKHRFLSASR